MSKAAELAALIGSQSALSNRNLIINGAMRIDQRNGGSSVSTSGGGAFVPDRWGIVENSDGTGTAQQVTDSPTGFTNSFKVTTGTADTSLAATQYMRLLHTIEGNNIAHLNWGSANAKDVTLSFWVKSSLTGSFGASISNSARNRSYPFTYTVNSAGTWEYKTVTIPGDTTGTWLTDNGIGMRIYFGLGYGSTYAGTAGAWAATRYESATGGVSVIGTASASWQITGVQLEVGEQATPFEHRSFADELARCQRYFAKTADDNTSRCVGHGSFRDSTQFRVIASVPVTMRIDQPSLVEKSPGSQTYRFNGSDGNYNNDGSTAATLDNGGQPKFTVNVGGFSGLSAGDNGLVKVEGSGNWLALDAEL